jgi:hypothetical protein
VAGSCRGNGLKAKSRYSLGFVFGCFENAAGFNILITVYFSSCRSCCGPTWAAGRGRFYNKLAFNSRT